jgi:hypothetical protein
MHVSQDSSKEQAALFPLVPKGGLKLRYYKTALPALAGKFHIVARLSTAILETPASFLKRIRKILKKLRL